jgi:Ran GTPase-activating protein (RanGAP) involved in mRNA processing and transport
MEPPLHPRQRFILLLEDIASSNVERAEIRYQGLHDEQAIELAGALRKTESLILLDLTCSSISTAGIVHVCQSLPTCLMNLTLSSIPLSPSAASALGTLLRMSSSLVELHLHDCQLKGEGW